MTMLPAHSPDLAGAAAEAVALLIEIQAQGLAPDEARRACRPLQERHPTLQCMLIAEREPCTETHYYEILLGAEGMGGLVVAYCPDRDIPWMMRGAVRLGDDLVRVNGVPIAAPDAMQHLDVAHDSELASKLVDAMLVRQALDDYGLSDAPVDDGDLQRALDDFRRSRGLFSAAEMHDWMAARGVSQEILEKVLEDRVRAEALRACVTSGRIASFFEEHRAAFDLGVATLVELAALEDAERFVLCAANEPFHAVADRFAVDCGANIRTERRRRFEWPADLRAAVFAPPASGLPIVRRDSRFVVVRPVASTPARDLDDDTFRTARTRMFDEWLAEQRRLAQVEWSGATGGAAQR